MTRAASFALVAAVAMLSLASSAGSSGSAARPFKIIAVSHTHPAGSSFSWVCAKIRKTTAKKATVTAGAGLGRRTIRGRGTKIVAFKITSAGTYQITVKQGAKSASKSYTVPAPPEPANGPFPCV